MGLRREAFLFWLKNTRDRNFEIVFEAAFNLFAIHKNSFVYLLVFYCITLFVMSIDGDIDFVVLFVNFNAAVVVAKSGVYRGGGLRCKIRCNQQPGNDECCFFHFYSV
ncbi:hypothetical protein SDC9_129445 [bioreactor metagenome]|uniref:Uncharacterized protein n=1 Tax=bioreactor metagenome TaxID=1076179 RepID=A0A645CZI5_9ZZZZ